jgi:hypothetical protein
MRKIFSIVGTCALLFAFGTNEARAQGCLRDVNLVQNPDFELGDININSELDQFTVVCEDNEYTVGDNFQDKCGGWPNITGNGNFMIVDGPEDGADPIIIWSQEIDVCRNTEYTFSYMANNLYPALPFPQFALSFVIDGVVVATPANMAGGWNLYTTTWNSGIAPPPTIVIALQIPSGDDHRDFGLDDIFFGYCDNMTISGPTTICSGGCAIVFGVGAAGYTWDHGPTTAATAVCPTTTTLYTVTGTDAGGCLTFGPLTTTVTVNPSPTVTATASPATLTPPSVTTSNLTTSVSGGSGFTYSWAPATGLSSTTISNPVATPTTTTVYTVTVTNSSGCTATQTVQVTVNPQDLCMLTYDYDIGPGESVATVFSPLTAVGGQDVHIDGLFTVGSNFTFSGCNMVMEPGSRIEVSSGATLYIIGNTHIYTCEGMWDGIYLHNGARLEIYNTAIIEDAIAAVTINQGSTALIQNCIFNRNYTAVEVTANTSATSPLTMIACIVTCLDLDLDVNPSLNPSASVVWANILAGPPPVYPNINMKAPNNTLRSVYGVRATDVNALQVGSGGSSPGGFNGFNNLTGVAILATRSNVAVYNNHFRSMTNTLTCSSCPSNAGRAILGQGSTTAAYAMKVGGTAANQGNDFYNIKFAVELNQYTTNLVLENTITNTSSTSSLFGGYGKSGVQIIPAASSTIEVSGNTITNAATAVAVQRANTTAGQVVSLKINQNEIIANSTGFCTTGISLTDAVGVALSTSTHEINFNLIVEAATCIAVQDVTVKNNIYYNSCLTRYAASGNLNGIKLTNCQFQNVQQNHTKYNVTVGTNLTAYGISLTNSPSNYVSCNTIENATRSLVFSGNCTSAHNVKQNTMRNAQAGLVLLTSGTTIGQQGISVMGSDNYWDMTPTMTMTTQIVNNSGAPLTLYVSAGSPPAQTTVATSFTGVVNVLTASSAPSPCGGVPARFAPEENVVSAVEESNSPIMVFPNPSNGQFTVSSVSSEPKDVMVYDMNGRLVFSVMQTTDTNIAVDISGEAKGLYVVKVISGDDVQSTRISNQ